MKFSTQELHFKFESAHPNHESLGNVKPADVYYGRAPAILRQRQMIKLKTLEHRRLLFQKQAA
jgi:hypothetical protein